MTLKDLILIVLNFIQAFILKILRSITYFLTHKEQQKLTFFKTKICVWRNELNEKVLKVCVRVLTHSLKNNSPSGPFLEQKSAFNLSLLLGFC